MNTYGRTGQERDNIHALKSLIEYHANYSWTWFFTSGNLREFALKENIDGLMETITRIRRYDDDRDANGIDIAGALEALSHIQPE